VILCCLLLEVAMLHVTRLIVVLTATAAAQTPDVTVESNVVFGMYSGLALLMDVHRPPSPNGVGIVYVPGSGFHTPLGYDAPSITRYTAPYVPALTRAGYTVFVVNHRAAPRFRYPAAVEDVQRAVRHVRHHAARYGIASDRIGAAGYSSGGTLASLLGVLDGKGAPEDNDPVERESARVQCVVAGGGGYDFTLVKTLTGLPVLGSYFGSTIALGYHDGGPEYRTYQQGSPRFHVSGDDAPTLLVHGDADEILPFAQVETMERALREAGVPAKLVRMPGGTHFKPRPPGAPDDLTEMTRWFDRYLRGKP
jgi:acetyl esterase/lipase